MSTIFAPLTPVQYAPVITVRVSGPDSLKVLDLFEANNLEPIKLKPRYALKAVYKSITNSKIKDEVIIIYYKSPASYTGEDVIEISFHGNPVIIRTVTEDLSVLGLRPAEPGEFTRRAFLTQKITLTQAESIDALIHARTDLGVKTAVNRLSGDLDVIFEEIQNSLLNISASLEAEIDFHEEDGDFDYSEFQNSLNNIILQIKKLTESFKTANMAINGVSVAIIGKPNTGKSSLFNALLKKERAIVTNEAGTTRDMLTEQLNLEGINFNIIDTAGIRETESEAENAGIKISLEMLKKADIVIFVLDLSDIDTLNSLDILSGMDKQNIIITGTKADLTDADYINHPDIDIEVSVKNNMNIDRLFTILADKASRLLPKDCGELSLISQRQYLDCVNALNELKDVDVSLMSPDIVSYHIKKAIEILSGINNSSELILDRIFSNFCIGK